MRKTLMFSLLILSTQAFAGGHQSGGYHQEHHSGGQPFVRQISATIRGNYHAHQGVAWQQVNLPFVTFFVPVVAAEEIVTTQTYSSIEEQEFVEFMDQCIRLTHNVNTCRESFEDR